jgi:hypothetical protein
VQALAVQSFLAFGHGCPLGVDDPPAALPSGIDHAIRLSTAAAVLAMAGIAAYWAGLGPDGGA